MYYFYVLCGITSWVLVVAFSSYSLISYENTKNIENSKSFIHKTTQEVFSIKKDVPATSKQTSEGPKEKIQTLQKVAEQAKVLQPKSVTPTIIKKVSEENKIDDEREDD
jgi:hypothetical protein